MRKTALVLLTAVLLSACGQIVPVVTPTNENDVIGGQVVVDFLSSAEQWSTSEIVNTHKDYYLENKPDYVDISEQKGEDAYLEGFETLLSFWKVGTINNGDYAGQSLVLAHESCNGPCPASIFRYAVDEATDTWTAILRYSDEPNMEMPGGPVDEKVFGPEVAALETPQTLELYSDDGVYLMDPRAELDPNFYGEDYYEQFYGDDLDSFNERYKALTVSNTSYPKHLTRDDYSCLYGVTPDGILVRYLITPSIFGAEFPEGKGAVGAVPNTVINYDLDLADGGTEKHEYMLFAGGCGFSTSCLGVTAATSDEEDKLKKVGSLDGRDVYMFSSLEEAEDPDWQTLTGKVQNAYNSYKMTVQYKDPPETALSMDEFLAAHNVVLFELESGGYTLSYDSAYAPGVECGKPVIYLYPTAAQQVSVKVDNITFSKTIPDHGQNGWTVWANPNGTLKNLADGLSYPYLFWEGQSSAKVTMGEGWTLAKKDIATKLPVALTSMGLNTKETADFMEFWLPRLQAVKTPYVLFNFEGTTAMNIVAPLTITPAPDSLLRVFMYYQGVSQAGRAMPKYTAPARTGFSVIEWGGSLY
jgi:hypothetical protein